MINLYDLLASPVFWAIIVAAIAAQGVKIVLLGFKQRQKFIWEDLFVTGSMPSAHAAIVVSLIVILLLTEGFSPLFFVSFVFLKLISKKIGGITGDILGALNEIIETLVLLILCIN